jgi:hypothetical protein
MVALTVLPSALLAQERVPEVKKYIGVKAAMTPVRMHEQPLIAVVQIAQVTKLPSTITDKDHSMLNRVVGDLESGNIELAMNRWERFVAQLAEGGVAMDINSLIQFVLRESYLETNEDLRFYAEKVRFFNDTKKRIREHIHGLRETLAAAQRDSIVRVQTITIARQYKEGEETVQKASLKAMSDREFAEYTLEWCDKLQEVGDDAQLANIDLQNALQKQQQTLQTMSNVSKMLHDTAMAVIRKIG